MKKLINIVLAGIFGVSFGFNKVYSQGNITVSRKEAEKIGLSGSTFKQYNNKYSSWFYEEARKKGRTVKVTDYGNRWVYSLEGVPNQTISKPKKTDYSSKGGSECNSNNQNLSGLWKEQSEKAESLFGKSDRKYQKNMKTGLYTVGENFPVTSQIIDGVEIAKDPKYWWNEKSKKAEEVNFLFYDTKDIYYIYTGKEESKNLWNQINKTPNTMKYIGLENVPGGGLLIKGTKAVKNNAEKVVKYLWEE